MEIEQLLQLLLQQIAALTSDSASYAREYAPHAIEVDATYIRSTVLNPTYGLPAAYYDRMDILDAIRAVRLDSQEPHLATLTDVMTALAALTPVTLPTVPPPGYGSGDLSEVWLSNLETYDWCPVD